MHSGGQNTGSILPEKLPDVFHSGWGLELHHSFDFVQVRFYARVWDMVAEGRELTQAELTFLELQRQASFEHLFQICQVPLKSGGSNDNVVQIHGTCFVDETSQYIVHQSLKCCWCVAETEGENMKLEETAVRYEGCLWS